MAKRRYGTYDNDEPDEREDDKPEQPPEQPPPEDTRPENPLPPKPKMTITWLGPAPGAEGGEARASKKWNGIDFPVNQPVNIDHLSPREQQAMVQSCEGSKAWKVEVVEGS